MNQPECESREWRRLTPREGAGARPVRHLSIVGGLKRFRRGWIDAQLNEGRRARALQLFDLF